MADQDTHPLVRLVLETLEDSNAEMHGVTFDATCVNCCGDFTPGVTAAVAAVLRAVSERIVAHHMDLSGYAISEHIDAWAAEIEGATVNVDRSSVNSAAAASSVPTGTPEPAPRRLPGNQPLVLRDLTVTPIPGNPTNGDARDD